MPWSHCDVTDITDDGACPECGVTKDTWTLEFNVTRQFVIKRSLRFELLENEEGVDGEPYSVELPDGSVVEGELNELGSARVTCSGGLCTVSFPERPAGTVVRATEDDGESTNESDPATGDEPASDAEGEGEDDEETPNVASFQVEVGPKHTFLVGATQTIVAESFLHDSALPGPAALRELRSLATDTDSRFLVVAHPADDADLAQRRAQAVHALLAGDAAALAQVADADGWETRHHQSILRTLGYNPGAIDNDLGALATQAVERFEHEYNAGEFNGGQAPTETLEVNGELDAGTRRALLQAFAAEVAIEGEVTLADEETAELVPLEELSGARVVVTPATDETPQVVREVVPPTRNPFWDLRWQDEAVDTHSVQLSALTDLPDGSEVTFRVYRCREAFDGPPPTSSDEDAERPEDTEELQELSGEVAGGVAWTRWEASTEEDPFEYANWFSGTTEIDGVVDESFSEESMPDSEGDWAQVEDTHDAYDELEDMPDLGEDEEDEEDEELGSFQPFVFAIESGDDWVYSQPPGARLNRMRFPATEGAGLALAADGGLISFAIDGDGFPQARDDVWVVSVLSTHGTA